MDIVAETEELTKRFGPVRAVDGLNLTVAAGEVFGLLGPNGAGKTTTLRLLLGLVRADAGRVSLWDEEVHPGASALRRVGAVVERPAFYPYLSGRDNLAVLAAAHGLGRDRPRAVAEALRRAHLDTAADRRVGGYSAGMRQRLALAAALLGDPRLLVLDEPTSGLDPEGIAELRESIVLREPYAFPQSLLAVLAGAWPVPLACLFLGAATVGGDFGWGTIRTALLAWSDRTGWLVARLLSLAALAAFMLAAVLVVGALLPLVLIVAGEQLPAVDPPTGLLVVVGAQLLVAIQYAALGVAGGLVARSLAGGFLLAGGYLLFDTALAGLGAWSAAGLRAVPAFSFSGSGRGLIEAANRVSGAPPPLDESITGLLPPLALPGWLSLVVVLVWLGALAALALVRLRRLDVT